MIRVPHHSGPSHGDRTASRNPPPSRQSKIGHLMPEIMADVRIGDRATGTILHDATGIIFAAAVVIVPRFEVWIAVHLIQPVDHLLHHARQKRTGQRGGATVSKPQKGDLTAEQYDRLQEVAGSVGRKWLGQLIASPEYQAMDTESQADEISDVMTRARRAAKAAVLTGEPITDARPKKKRSGSKRLSGLPEGFEVDPLPPGFELDR